MSASPAVIVERRAAAVRITFNRPERLNALTTDMLVSTAEQVSAAGADPSVRLIVLSGAGKAFSSGADLVDGPTDPDGGTTAIDAANRLVRAMRDVPQPVLAAVNGPAVGVGCSIALAADIAVAAESAYFLLAFANVGLMPDGGATALLPAAIGRARATRMVILAERIAAKDALEWGLIARATPDATFAADLDELIERLSHGPTAAYARAKAALNATSLAYLDVAMLNERAGQRELFGSDDFAEGVRAFAARTAPGFHGR